MKESININKEDFGLGSNIKCPLCGDYDTYQFNTDECNFEYNDKGMIITDHHCNNCKENFRLTTKFKYTITEQYAR